MGASLASVETQTNPDVMVRGQLVGPFSSGGLDDGKLRLYIGRKLMATGDEDDHTLVANVRDLWLHRELQRQGYGRCLVEVLMLVWRAVEVEEVRAVAATEAGRAAFARWGFAQGKEDENGHVPYVLRLTP